MNRRLIDPQVAAAAAGRFIAGTGSKLTPGHEGVPQQPTGPPPRLAYSIREFCAATNISAAFYFELKRAGLGPREMALGTRRLISVDEAKRWAAERTAVSNPASKPEEAA